MAPHYRISIRNISWEYKWSICPSAKRCFKTIPCTLSHLFSRVKVSVRLLPNFAVQMLCAIFEQALVKASYIPPPFRPLTTTQFWVCMRRPETDRDSCVINNLRWQASKVLFASTETVRRCRGAAYPHRRRLCRSVVSRIGLLCSPHLHTHHDRSGTL
jgi:hypothetical protein